MRDSLKYFEKRALPAESEITAAWNCSFPKISIVCTAYNQERFIQDAIGSFLTQELAVPFEIIVHDDASTDATADILKAFAEKYPRLIKVIYQQQNQYSKDRIRPIANALAQARGKYIAFCEGDDFWISPAKLSKQLEILESNDSYSGCSTFSVVLDSSKATVRLPKPGPARTLELIDLVCGEKAEVRTCSLMLRRSSLPSVMPEQLSRAYAGDNLIRVLLAVSGPIYILPIALACYRVHDQGVWSSLRGCELARRQAHDLQLLRELVPRSLSSYVDVRLAVIGLRFGPGGKKAALFNLARIVRHPVASFYELRRILRRQRRSALSRIAGL